MVNNKVNSNIENPSAKKLEINGQNAENHVFKEKKYGWLIVFASFLMQACSLGVCSGYGTFQEFYANELFAGTQTSIITLIGVTGPAMIGFTSIMSGTLIAKLGYRGCTLTGALIVSVSLLVAVVSPTIC